MLATPGTLEMLGSDADWAFEMKWDGVRALIHVASGQVRLVSRNDLDMTVAYPEIAALGRALDHSAVLDGEIVSLDAAGRPSFARLQKRMHVADAVAANRLAGSDPAVVLLFDVLRVDDESLLSRTWGARRECLESLGLTGPAWQTPPVFVGTGAEAVETSREHGLEGVVAKRLRSTYTPGRRSADWVKIKNIRTQEVVVAGWTPGHGRRIGTIGALLLGVPEADRLHYVGKVGTGFAEATLRDLAGTLLPLEITACPLDSVPRPDAREAHWVEPVLVGEVAFAEWTGDGRLRHPAWRGLRPDKTAAEVVRET
jgi:bifunctional non-homologous end joining protein LigD